MLKIDSIKVIELKIGMFIVLVFYNSYIEDEKKQ